jgi:hypothetical protein
MVISRLHQYTDGSRPGASHGYDPARTFYKQKPLEKNIPMAVDFVKIIF